VKVQALERVGNRLRLLDQTVLPHQVVYKDLDDYREIIVSIKRLEVRGAPAIGIAAAYALAIGVQQDTSHQRDYPMDQLSALADEIRRARPTAVNLFWAIDRVMDRIRQAGELSKSSLVDMLWGEAEAIHEEDRRMCRQIGENGAALIADGDTLLTHCNTGALATGGIGTALGVIYVCRDQGKRIKVFADETRPLLQGARLTAWELMQEGIDVTVNCDNMAGTLLQQGRINHVIVGADRIAANGDTANKIGTYPLAVLARAHGVPFYVAAPSTTFDLSIATGKDIVIEERGGNEITEVFGTRVAPEGVNVFAPAFDVTPTELVSAYITDTGVRPGGRTD